MSKPNAIDLGACRMCRIGRGEEIDFYEMVDQILELLRGRGRVSYRALKRQFDLDDEVLEDLKEAILFDHPQAKDEDGRGLVWVGCSASDQDATPPAAFPASETGTRDPNMYTPPHLIEKILTSRAALQGERKQVTVLFCDMANSTSIAEQLGAEAMHDLLNQFFKLVLDAVHRYEGNVNQFLGDGFMALFGAPIAHENHAQRAVLTALELRHQIEAWNNARTRQSDAQITLRIGINTGTVVVGAIGDNLRMDYTAVGDTTNVAARLEGQAAPDQIVISESTYRLVEGYCQTRSLGTFDLKGKADPMLAWEVLAAFESVNRLDVEIKRGLTHFMGRERELQTLQNCFAQAQAGHGQMVFLVGDPGIGKSRLLLEFRQRIAATDATWLEGRALSFGSSSVFHPLIDMLKRSAGIEEAEADATVVTKIEQTLLSHSEALRSDLPYLRYLLALDPGDENVRRMDPQLRRNELFRALQRVLFHASELSPRVIVLEDIHWMDQATQDFLKVIADSITTSHVLFLLTYRPGYAPPFGERTYHTHLTLQPLSTKHSTQIARTILGVDFLPDELASLIDRKTEGNPFFVEQVVRSLQEVGAIRRVEDRCVLTRPIEDISVPETVQDVLSARFDRLEEAHKTTLQFAAVVGREFTRRLLVRLEVAQSDLLDTCLRDLTDIEMIREMNSEPDLSYIFKHALTREVAYQSLLVKSQQYLHRLIGETIEKFEVDHLIEHAEVLAHHFEQGEMWKKALTYLVQAGQKAQQASALKEALDFHARALVVCEQLGSAVDPETMSIYARKGEAHFLRSEFLLSVESHRQVLEISRRNGDRAQEAFALYKMGLGYHWAHEFEEALQCSESAKALAQQIGAGSTVAASTFVIGWVRAVLGDLDEALRHCNDALRISREAEDEEQEGFCLWVLGQIRNWKGEYAQALRLLDQALHIGRTQNLPFLISGVLWMRGIILCGRGDYEKALASLEEALDLSERLGDYAHRGRILNTLGWVCGEFYDLEAALQYNQACLDASEEIGDPEVTRNAQLNQGDTLLLLGRLEEAEEHLEEVHESLQRHGTWGEDWMKWRYAQHMWHSLGELWLAKGDSEMALIYTGLCCEGAEPTGSLKNLAKGWRLKGQALLAQGRDEEAEQALRRALAISRDLGNPPQIWRTHQALGMLYEERGETGRSHAAYHEALDIIHEVATQLQDSERRHTFLDAQPVRQIREGTIRTGRAET